MNIHEARLRAMLDPDSPATWNLNVEDRDAIAWVLDAFERVKGERDEIRREWSGAAHSEWERRQRIEAAASGLFKALGEQRKAPGG